MNGTDRGIVGAHDTGGAATFGEARDEVGARRVAAARNAAEKERTALGVGVAGPVFRSAGRPGLATPAEH